MRVQQLIDLLGEYDKNLVVTLHDEYRPDCFADIDSFHVDGDALVVNVAVWKERGT